jgi:hypothetical protein
MRERAKSFYVVFAIAGALIVPAAIALRTVVHPAILQATSDNPTPLGYTWSLALFIIPIGVLAWWFACRPDLKFPRKAFWRTIAVLAPLGFVLDLLFGNAFFIFQNKAATLGCNVPASGGAIPIEEFIFYLTGFMLVLLSYIWCDEYWMAAYNVPDYKEAARDIPRIVRFHFGSVVLGVALIAAAIVYRKFLSGVPEGFPWYFIYLICASLVPSAGFFLHRATIYQLARLQLHVFSAPPYQLALGSDARFAVWLVGISQECSDWAAHRSMVRAADRSSRRLVGCELYHRHHI